MKYNMTTMRKSYPALTSACLLLLPSCRDHKPNADVQKKPNVLLICVDDLRRELISHKLVNIIHFINFALSMVINRMNSIYSPMHK